jgi:hypothetical protein
MNLYWITLCDGYLRLSFGSFSLIHVHREGARILQRDHWVATFRAFRVIGEVGHPESLSRFDLLSKLLP